MNKVYHYYYYYIIIFLFLNKFIDNTNETVRVIVFFCCVDRIDLRFSTSGAMGNIFCSDCCKKQGYKSLDDNFEEGISIFDSNINFFNGLWIERKFTQNTAYERRFLWVTEDDTDASNRKGYSIHMSEFAAKNRRHKEANLKDVVKIEIGKPSKAALAVNDNHCLTINFKLGGGIDLKFENQVDRDLWHKKLKTILAYHQSLEKKSLDK